MEPGGGSEGYGVPSVPCRCVLSGVSDCSLCPSAAGR